MEQLSQYMIDLKKQVVDTLSAKLSNFYVNLTYGYKIEKTGVDLFTAYVNSAKKSEQSDIVKQTYANAGLKCPSKDTDVVDDLCEYGYTGTITVILNNWDEKPHDELYAQCLSAGIKVYEVRFSPRIGIDRSIAPINMKTGKRFEFFSNPIQIGTIDIDGRVIDTADVRHIRFIVNALVEDGWDLPSFMHSFAKGHDENYNTPLYTDDELYINEVETEVEVVDFVPVLSKKAEDTIAYLSAVYGNEWRSKKDAIADYDYYCPEWARYLLDDQGHQIADVAKSTFRIVPVHRPTPQFAFYDPQISQADYEWTVEWLESIRFRHKLQYLYKDTDYHPCPEESCFNGNYLAMKKLGFFVRQKQVHRSFGVCPYCGKGYDTIGLDSYYGNFPDWYDDSPDDVPAEDAAVEDTIADNQ